MKLRRAIQGERSGAERQGRAIGLAKASYNCYISAQRKDRLRIVECQSPNGYRRTLANGRTPSPEGDLPGAENATCNAIRWPVKFEIVALRDGDRAGACR